jgi:Condensation domain/Phosphopantetheine attachment site
VAGAPPKQWVVPASYAQERVWFASQLVRGVPVYHVVDDFRLAHPLTAETFRSALRQVCDRHEVLRTSFRADDGGLMQVVHGAVELPLREVDLGGLPEQAQTARVEELIAELAHAEIPLDRPPLWRAVLVRLADDAWVVLFVAHHTIVDAASQWILRAELRELCAAAVEGRPARLPELPIQYADYAVWQRNRLGGGRLAELLAYWREALAGLPAVHRVRTDRPRSPERSFAGADVVFPLPDAAAVTGLARRYAATPFAVLLAAWGALLHRLSGADDIAVGLLVEGRDRPELRPLIGMFVNTIVTRVDASGDPTFAELLGRVRVRLAADLDHQEMPFQKLLEALAGQRELGVAPLYQIGLNHITIGFSRRSATVEDELMLEVVGDQARLEYSTALFDPATVDEIAAGYHRVLATVVADPETRMSALPAEPRSADVAAGPQAGAEYMPPRTAAEELVAAVWAEVLGVERVGALDDFFDLGGHSLLALRVIARLSAAAEVELTIQGFFEDTTVAGVAAELERVLAAEIDLMPEDEAERLAGGGR